MLNGNAVKVLEKRYLKKDNEGKIIENPEDLFSRVARSVAAAEGLYGASDEAVKGLEQRFFDLMASLDFLPNSPTLMNAGRRLGQLSACFVLPVGDSMEEIFDAVKYAAVIHKSGGGTGFSFSRLRPSGDIVGSTQGVSSGPISFMMAFDAATETVKQGGTRRGANMGILRVDHPDILNFIKCKDDSAKLNNFNISVAITDEFMKAVEEDGEYDLVNPRTGVVARRLRAREVFDQIVKHAWGTGEPGIVFIDRMNKANPTPKMGSIESTNPCGEQPLLPYESCNLGSINLVHMVKDDMSGKPEVDWDKLRETVQLAVRFLDNVIDVNKYPLPQIEKMTKANRKIGLGVMGWADMLVQLGIPYNSDEAIGLAEQVARFIDEAGGVTSAALAQKRGTFPNYKGSIYEDSMEVRNATITTIAPTGTLSIIAGCSSGVEPIFAVSFTKTVLEGIKLIEVNPYFEAIVKERGFYSDELMGRIADEGSIQHIDEIPEDLKKLFVTAHDITPADHIKMQAAFQKFVDNAVSKTVNFPRTATADDVRQVYLLAYQLGCKGVTVYRDGSRDSQVLTRGKESDAKTVEGAVAASKIVPRKRPSSLRGETKRLMTGCGKIYVTVNNDEGNHPFELFTSMGKAGGCAASQSEALGRLISLCLRSGIDPDEIIQQLKGISCYQHGWEQGGTVFSCPDAIARALDAFFDNGSNGNGNGPVKANTEPMHIGACMECGGPVEHEGGCAICRNCGFTKCS